MDKEVQTERILRAIANPFVTMLGYLTGRQLLRRPGYELALNRVIGACAKYGVAIESTAILGGSRSTGALAPTRD